jgi:1-acyl-sn-glycerol-3-phosphate acyltransferase
MQDHVPVHHSRGRFGRSGPYRGVWSECIRGLCWLFLKATGWHVATDWPDVPKSVIVSAPHTSNFDGLVMLAMAGWYRQKLSWMGKASLVRGPFGGLVRRAGCVPVDRSKSADIVSLMKDAFESADTLHLAVSPEGTRDANPVWKTGFWHIARSAGVPLFSAVLDYGTKEMRLEGPVMPSNDIAADMAVIVSHYRGAKGRYPERFCLPDQTS